VIPDRFKKPVHVAPHLRARGVDLASYQSLTETREILADHLVNFGIVKATQGLTYRNPLADRQVGMLHAHGAVVGLYHYLDQTDGTRQWDHFESACRQIAGTIRILVAVDYEGSTVSAHGDAVCKAFIRRGKQRGYHVGLYGSSSVARRNFGQAWTWAAWWSASPPPFRWDVWQFADQPVCDWNVFRGDLAALHAFAVTHGHIHRVAKKPPLRWWIHDNNAQRSLGPFRSAPLMLARFVPYAFRHPNSRNYTLRKA
jgi:GH25 family lysozyme M1 (1,4-beta-N-acetylmuramidase)